MKSDENMKSKVKIRCTSKLEKYPPGTSQEDIREGKVKPLEVIEDEKITYINREDAKMLGLVGESD